MEEQKYWVWLSKIDKRLTPILNMLLEKYKTPENLWNLDKIELLKNNIGIELVEEILKKEYKENLDKYIEYMLKYNIEIIPVNSKHYPQKLKYIYSYPLVLYIKGNKNIINRKSLAIIGSRNCSSYGKNVANFFAKEISKYNINIISGLARGIDTFAHVGALEKGGKTIAVIGTGLDITYPDENKNLQEKILANDGVIISEFIVGTKINKINFPIRNRIISGLSDGVLVVEAGKKSGTFITVEHALEQGKTVYVVPGNINSRTSEGTNELAKQGAKIVVKKEDILEDFIENKK